MAEDNTLFEIKLISKIGVVSNSDNSVSNVLYFMKVA